jgi:hypothetical protein
MEITLSQWLIVIGLFADIIGVILVGFEIINKYEGDFVELSQKLEDMDYSRPALKSDYKSWALKKHKVMSLGLGILIFGFLLQIAGTLI